MLTTHSPRSYNFSSVCLVVLSRILRAGEKTTIGGSALNRLKKLKGLRFTLPYLSWVDTSATGRGAIANCRSCCRRATSVVLGSSIIWQVFFVQGWTIRMVRRQFDSQG